MGLRSTPLAKCLDKKLLLFGFEVPDVLAIFLTLSILNFIFGQVGQSASVKFVFVWIPTILLATTLRCGKKGKPDHFLIHWLRFQIKPGTYQAFPDASRWSCPPRVDRSHFFSKREVA